MGLTRGQQQPLADDLGLGFLDDRAHRMLGNVKHVARLPMVGLLGHTLLEGATALDVNDVPKLVVLEVGGEMLHRTCNSSL